MRIGIVTNDDEQAVALLNEFPGHEVLWLAGSGLRGEYRCPVYQDYSEANADRVVDLIIDCVGDVQLLEAMVVDVAAALFLLNAGRRGTGVTAPTPVLTSVAGQLTTTLEKITTQINLMDNYSKKLILVGTQLDSTSKAILEDLNRTGRILDSITRIAKRSKIIGLNSAIEAARVGEQGRGFAIVAEEIKTLADDSSQSVQDIERILSGIQRRSDEFAQSTGTVHDVSDLQLEVTKQVTTMLQSLKELGQYLRKLSENQSA